MKNNVFKRAVAASVLGTTLAVGGIALAATSASAAVSAPTATTPGSPTFTTYGPNGDWFVPSVGYTWAEPITSVTYTLDETGADTYVLNEYFNSDLKWDANNVAFLPGFSGAGNDVSIKKISATQYEVTRTYATPTTSTTAYALRMYSSAASAQGTVVWDVASVTPASTGVAENVTNEPGRSATATWGTVFTTPVIAPAVAGIALLGAVGATGGVLVGRRKKKQTA